MKLQLLSCRHIRIYRCLFLLIILTFGITTTSPVLVSLQQLSGKDQSSLSIVEEMREGNLTTSVADNIAKSKNDSRDYIFSNNRNKVSTPENNSHTHEFGKGVNIALIKPTFTAAAYNNSFYKFYRLYSNIPAATNVTTNLNLLSSKVSNETTASVSSAFTMLFLLKNLKWLTPESNIKVLDDVNVDS